MTEALTSTDMCPYHKEGAPPCAICGWMHDYKEARENEMTTEELEVCVMEKIRAENLKQPTAGWPRCY